MAEPTPTPAPEAKPDVKPPTPITDAERAELEAFRKEKASRGADPKPEPSLADKVENERKEKEKKANDSRDIESALTFNLSAADFLKTNEAILPSNISEIFKAADKENYSTALEKANATKSAIVQSFFGVQANLDLLTPTQKTVLADYLKLTKDGKDNKASEVYTNLFEPTLMSLKRVKKAEEVAKSKLGYGSESDSSNSYKNRMMDMANKKWGKKK